MCVMGFFLLEVGPSLEIFLDLRLEDNSYSLYNLYGYALTSESLPRGS